METFVNLIQNVSGFIWGGAWNGTAILPMGPLAFVLLGTGLFFMFRLGGRTAPDGSEVPGTQGILCDPSHPLFRSFPTECHSNWQWWQLVKHSAPLILDGTDKAFRPIVQVIDGIDRNHKLGLILEAKVGGGRLLVCSIDLPALQEHPEARQLLASIQRYMASRHFAPKHELSAGEIRDIL